MAAVLLLCDGVAVSAELLSEGPTGGERGGQLRIIYKE